MQKNYLTLSVLSAILLVLVGCVAMQSTTPDIKPMPKFDVNNASINVVHREMFSCNNDGQSDGFRFAFKFKVPEANVGRLFMSVVFNSNDMILAEYHPGARPQLIRDVWVDYNNDGKPEYHFSQAEIESIPGYPNMCVVVETLRQ